MIDTKLLRQKILDLAIRGKLVPQDPKDEPASELLKKIKAEKEALIKAGKLKRDKHESFIFRGDDKRYYEQIDGKINDITGEIPFDLPEGWAWCRLNAVGTWGAGATPARNNKAYYDGGTIPWLKTGDLNDGFIFDTPEKITGKALRETSVQLNKIGSVLIAMYGATIGKVGILQIEATTNQACCACQPFNGLSNRFLFFFLLSQKERFKIIGGGGAQPNISKDKIVAYLFPLPPLAEQKRIVTQIEGLLKCVDEIDKESETLEKSITLAKQKILDLAIRGKLVPQDPADEPASQLLKRIKAEKEALVKAGKLKRDKHESFIFRGDDNCYYEQLNGKAVDITDEIPFEIPESWCWCRQGTLCNYGVCQSADAAEIPENAWVLDLEDIEKNTGRLLCRIYKQDRPPTSSKHVFHQGNVLYSKLRTYLNKVLVADQDGFCTSEILPLDFGRHILPEFARCVLMSKMFLDYTAQCGYGVKMPRLGTEDGRKALFPLPPLDEQKRIIAAAEQHDSILKSLQG